MATPNPDKNNSSATKQITFAAFNRYVRTMNEPSSPTLLRLSLEDCPPTSKKQTSTCQLTNGELSPTPGPGSPSAITPTPGTEPEELWSEQDISSLSHAESSESKQVNITCFTKIYKLACVCVTDCAVALSTFVP